LQQEGLGVLAHRGGSLVLVDPAIPSIGGVPNWVGAMRFADRLATIRPAVLTSSNPADRETRPEAFTAFCDRASHSAGQLAA
jgi:hypothetical protein